MKPFYFLIAAADDDDDDVVHDDVVHDEGFDCADCYVVDAVADVADGSDEDEDYDEESQASDNWLDGISSSDIFEKSAVDDDSDLGAFVREGSRGG